VKTLFAGMLGGHTNERAWRIGAAGEEAAASERVAVPTTFPGIPPAKGHATVTASPTSFQDVVVAFGKAARASLGGPGEPEAQLTAPLADFLARVGHVCQLPVTTHAQVRELDGAVRPDLGVLVQGVLTGHVELKAPGTALDPATYGKTTHNHRQWQRLKELPNLLHTNGLEWRLWRYGEPVMEPVHLHAKDLKNAPPQLTAPPSLELMLTDFLRWEPVPITSVSRLVETLAPLARMLREEVAEALRQERKAKKAGKEDHELPLLGLSRDWRKMLFPQAKDDEFADGFAQTVVFALLLAVTEGINLGTTTLHEVSRKLEGHHTLMGMTLNLLTEHVHRTSAGAAVDMIVRVLGAARWELISDPGKKEDVYLHLYEHFLGVYDPEKRKKTGSYYTPIEVVDFMVRFTDGVLRAAFNRRDGLRNPHVAVIDSSMGTGTYPLSVLRHVGDAAAAEFGPGARPEAVTSMAARLYGVELQSGPFSVAELRLSEAMKAEGAKMPADGLNMYVADTLEDPSSGSSKEFSYTEQLIARQRQQANRVKRDVNVQVSIGNPPYREKSKGAGGWIENGIDPKTGKPPLAAFQTAGNANHNQHLRNLYAYFWRWSTWKVFESTDDPDLHDGGNGIVCYITATGYLNGPGFRGMREYLRQKCSHGWIINITPEGRQPPPQNAIFNIQTPVAIALFARTQGTKATDPADIKYLELHGTAQAKFEQLAELNLDDERWITARTEWRAPFSPEAAGEWETYPAVGDFFPWTAPGVSANRTWVYGPSRQILEERLRELINEDDPARKEQLFLHSFHATLDKPKPALPGIDVETQTQTPFRKVVMVEEPKIVRICYRSLDRQYLIADSRLLHSPSSLWAGRIPGQVFACEMHSEHPGPGPGLSFTSLLPEKHCFNNKGGGGRALPMLHPDGTPNVPPGLMTALAGVLGEDVAAGDVMYYVAGLVAHSGYVEQFTEALSTPGLRVPVTTDRALWEQAVSLGAQAVWLQTFGERGRHPSGATRVRDTPAAHPSYDKPVGTAMPSDLVYDAAGGTISLGQGAWSGVTEEVRAYAVGGRNVVDSWFGYRRANPAGKRRSPLSDVVVETWPTDWSVEFSELLSAITQLVDLELEQETLLSSVLLAPKISQQELAGAGVDWPRDPIGKGDRVAKPPPLGEREARDFLADLPDGPDDRASLTGHPHPSGWVFVDDYDKVQRWVVNAFGQGRRLGSEETPDQGFAAL